MATSAGTIPINATFNGAQLEKDVLSALNRIQSKSSLNLNTRNFTQPLGKITGLANEFNKSLEASNARVVAFGASAGVIFAVQKSFSALVSTTIDVEKSLTDINIVLNTSSKGIKQFGDQLFEVAKNTGSSFKDAAGAATEFSRQGLGLEETLRRTRDALILTRLSGLDVVSSTEALTAAVNSFTKEALTTTDVVNKLAAVDAKFAVSSRDLSEAIQRVGSSASEAGVSFDELLGIVTSVQQTTARGGAVIGNALKTIFTRIERPQVIDDLKDFGIAVTDISGNALPTIKVIENLAQSFQNLNPIVKSQVAELVGGVYQINILKAALADVSKQNSAFAEATKASSQAVDDAIVKNDALNQSLSALFNATTANFAKFAVSIGESSVAPGIRKVLEYVNSALESYNEKDSESIGKKIATGLLTGITSFVTGPGLALGALAVGKLIGNFASFAGDATKNILGLNSLGRQQAVLQGEISNILSSNPQLIQQIIAGSKSRLQVEKEIKQTLIEQAAVSEMLKKSSASIAYGYVASGLGISTSGAITGKKSAGGYIPAQQQASEMAGAMQGGYAPGKVVAAPKSIGGVMNTAEKVKYIPGFAQPYILPPDGSRAARNLTAKSMSQNGIDPYKARGFVPNFAPRSLDNNGRYADSDWWYGSELKAPVSLSQIQTGTAAAWSEEKGFYRTDGKNFTANDLNTFIRRGATYGKIRESLQKIPDSFFQDDPRYKAGASKEQLIREFRPGSKISTVESVKEEAKRIFEPYTPPASMLIWDLARKNNDQDEVVDLEKLTNDKTQAGRQFKIKIRALSASPLNEEKFGLIDQTSKFARNITKKLAIGIPGAKSDYSDEEVDSYFDKTGKNYNVLAGTIFEAGTNLAASYVRDKEFNKGAAKLSAIGGDFDVKGGANLANVQKFFPGFTDSYGDYKLNNSYDAIREFIDKVQKEFPLQIGNHFNEQESKIAGITTSSQGFIPNFLKPKVKSFKTGEGERVLGPAPIVNKQTKEEFVKKVLEGNQDKSYIRYSKKDNSIDVDFVRSSRKGDGGKLWDRAGEIAKRLNVPLTTSAFLFQKENLEKYDAETNSFGDVLATGFPQLKWSERGKAKNTKLNIYNDYLQYPVESKRTFSEAQSLLNNIYKYDAPSLKDSILSENTYIKDIISYFAKGHVPNFAEGEMSGLSKFAFVAKTGSLFSGLIKPIDIMKFMSGKGSIESVFRPLVPLMKAPSKYIKSKGELDSLKSVLSTLYSSDMLGEQGAKFLSKIINETNFHAEETAQKADEMAQEGLGGDGFSSRESYLKYRLFGGKKSLSQYDKERGTYIPSLLENPDGTYRFNEADRNGRDEMKNVIESAEKAFSKTPSYRQTERVLEPKGKGGKFLGVSFKMGRFIGDLGRSRKAVRFDDTWDVALHQNENELLDGYLSGKLTKEEVNAIIDKQGYHENYGGSLDSLLLRDLVSVISNPATLKGIVKIPKDKRFSKGHIPNFNAVQEAIGREMSAGYSSSQVKVGQSSKLKTNFNPMGLGVYNSTEGSLNGGIGLAEKAGINPKTKGMSARGHIPNFAEFGGVDFSIAIGALALFATSIKSSFDAFKNLNQAIEVNKKTSSDAVKQYEKELQRGSGTISKEFAAREKMIQDEIKKTFTNVNTKLKLTSPSTGPLVMGTPKRDSMGLFSSVPQAASADEVARLAELREQRAANRKEKLAQREAARKGKAEAEAALSLASASAIDPKTMFNLNSKFSNYARAIGTPVGLAVSAVSNISGQFLSPENKTGRAVASGFGDVASFAGLGAQFGAPGAIAGVVIGIGSALLKWKDAKAEEAIDKINTSLDETKQKASDFSGAAQGYSTSLEGLQTALNDPKTKPEALLKFQNNLTESLSSIPEEFRVKVLKAGTDITKVAEAIAGVNKELGNTQKNIEKQLLIANIIKSETGLLDSTSVSPQNQKTLNALFSSSLNTESITSNFKGPNATDEMITFFNNIKKQAIGTEAMYLSGEGGDTYLGDLPVVNRSASESVKKELQAKGGLPDILGPVLDSAFKKFDVTAVESIIDALKKQGLAIIDSAKRAKILTDIVDDNTKKTIAFAEALKLLNATYNDSNLLISNQIDIEKNRAKTIREINKIQAEGAVSGQRAKIKGLLDASSPFINEGAKNNIQSQLDVNEINTRQSSKIREASNKVLDSFSDVITKRAEEARTTIVSAIESARDDKAITKERSVFQAQIQKLTPLISASMKRVTEGGNIGDIRGSLEKEIRQATTAFKPEQQDVLIQSLNLSFSSFEDTLAEIKAQGDVDIQIQEVQREYQKQSLAINQRLSFAGGAQALGSTGNVGVSDLFDNISNLVSELRQTNSIGNAAQKGSASFKLLDVLTNQLQLNRATEAPNKGTDAEVFNKKVSSDLNPLAVTAIAGRAQQITESLNLVRDVTEIQTGKSTQGTALGKAFDVAKESAVQTAIDQIASQFKLENIGSYLDLLRLEAEELNNLTQKQNALLEKTLPDTLNRNFERVITSQVGKRLDTLTRSLTEVINRLSVATQTNVIKTAIGNLLPTDIGPKERERLLAKLEGYKSGEIVENATPPPSPKSLKGSIANDTGLDVAGLEKYIKSFELVTVSNEKAFAMKYNDQVGHLRRGPKFREGFTSEVTEEDVKQAIDMQVKFFKAGKQTLTEERAKSMIAPIEQKPVEPVYKTYESESEKISKEFKTAFTSEQLKSLLEKIAEKRNLDKDPPLMRVLESPAVATRSSLIPLSPPPLPPGFMPESIEANTELERSRKKASQASALNSFDAEAIKEEIKNLEAAKNETLEREAFLLKQQIHLRNSGLTIQNKIAKDQFDLYYRKAYGEKFFKDEKAVQANTLIESEAREGRVAVGAITEKNTTYNRADFAKDTGQLIDTFQTDFKSGIGSAFGEAIKGTKTLKDAFRDMFQGILNRMLDKSLEMGVDALFAFGKAYTTGRKDGGPIKGYNSGGMVTGGSGMKDDVPAMMSGGEYVIKKSSVDKYGTDYLRNLNGGAIPRYATGGFSIDPLQNEFLYNDPERPTSGEYAVDSRLSAMALSDENNPQNRIREDRFNKLDQYLQDRDQFERDKKQALKNYRNQVNSTFYSGVTAAAVQLGAAGLTMGAQKLNAKPKFSNIPGAGLEPGGAGFSQDQLNAQYARYGRANGGYIPKFAGGGYTGKDNIPALLMGGEYVMNKKAVDMYGRDFMGQLNSGTLPKYANGGMVGTSYTGQNTPQGSVEELVTALNTLNENLSKDTGITQSESGKISAAGVTQESGMSVVNNISINMTQGGEVTSEANASTQQGKDTNQNNIQNNAKLAELLRSKVVEVLVEQKRPGGLLYASR